MPDERELEQVGRFHLLDEGQVGAVEAAGKLGEVEQVRDDVVQELVVAAQVRHRLVLHVRQPQEVLQPGAGADLEEVEHQIRQILRHRAN